MVKVGKVYIQTVTKESDWKLFGNQGPYVAYFYITSKGINDRGLTTVTYNWVHIRGGKKIIRANRHSERLAINFEDMQEMELEDVPLSLLLKIKYLC